MENNEYERTYNHLAITKDVMRDRKYVVLTTHPSPHYKNLVYVNECRTITYTKQKKKVWFCRCKYILDSNKLNITEIVDLICHNQGYVYIAGIKRFDVVTKQHERKLEAAKTLFGIKN